MRSFLYSLRFRLILLVLLAALPAIGLAIYNAGRQAGDARRDAQEQVLSLVHVAANEHKALIASTRQLLVTLAELSELRPEHASQCNALLARLLPLNAAYANLGAADADGNIFCSAVPTTQPVNVADRSWFIRAVQSRNFANGDYQIGRITGKAVIVFSYPLVDSNRQILAVVFAALDLGWMERLVQSASLPAGAVYTVVDRQGLILARHPEGEVWVGKPSPEGSVVTQALAKGAEGLLEAPGVDGVMRLYAYTPLIVDDTPGAYVFIGLPLSQVYAAPNRTLWFNLGILGGVALLGLVLAWLGGEAFLLRRIHALLAATRRVAAGDLSARSGLSYGESELSHLARAFDAMAENLESQHHQREEAARALQESKEYLSTLINTIGDAIFTVSLPERRIEFVNRAVMDIFGYQPEEVIGQSVRIFYPDEASFIEYGHRLQAALEQGEHALQAELALRRKDGSRLWCEIHTAFLPSEGAPRQAISVLRDITQRKRHERRVEAQALIAQALGEGLELPPLLDRLLDAAIHAVPAAEKGAILLADEAGVLQVRSQRGYSDLRWHDLGFAPDTGYAWRAFRQQRSLIIPDIDAEPDLRHKREMAEMVGVQSVIVAPLVVREQAIGVIALENARKAAFDERDLETLVSMASTAALVIENARLYEETYNRLVRIEALRKIDMAITSSLDPRVSLMVLLEQVTERLGVDAAAVLLYNPYLQELAFAAGRGFNTRAIEASRLRLGEGLAGRAALERRIVSVPDLEESPQPFVRADLLRAEKFVAYFAVPMIAKGQILGVLEVFHRAPMNVPAEWLNFLQALAAQAAIAIDNAQMFDNLQRSNLELIRAYDTTIEGWSRALDLRDKETEGHTQRVTEMTLTLARAMGISEAELVHIRRGALLHDIGKLGVPDSILLKPGPLTAEEWEIMRKHPQYAYEMLLSIEYLRPALDIPYCHHEKWDGTGYPRGLKGEQIPLAARIFAVVDVWDALTSDRPYRPAWSFEQARGYLDSQSGKHFDPEIVQRFKTVFNLE